MADQDYYDQQARDGYFDGIASALGLPADWREVGWDTPDTMLRVYERTDGGAMLCPWPGCKFARHDDHVEQLFRHVHDPRIHPRGEA